MSPSLRRLCQMGRGLSSGRRLLYGAPRRYLARLHVMMSRHLVVSSCLKMMLDCFGLRIGNHGLHLRYQCLAEREATRPHGSRLGIANEREVPATRPVMPGFPITALSRWSDTLRYPKNGRGSPDVMCPDDPTPAVATGVRYQVGSAPSQCASAATRSRERTRLRYRQYGAQANGKPLTPASSRPRFFLAFCRKRLSDRLVVDAVDGHDLVSR